MEAESSRGPAATALAVQGSAALACMSDGAAPSILPALRTLHRRYFIEARAEYDRLLELEAQREESPVRTALVDANAHVRDHLPHILGGHDAPEASKARADHAGWSHVFALLQDTRSAIDADSEHDAVERLRQAAEVLKAAKLRTRAMQARMESGTDACVLELEIVIGLCVTIASAGAGAEVAAAGAGLLKIAGISAATAAAARTTFSLAKVGSEHAQGITDDSWLSALVDGAEDGVTTLVFALVGGKLAARFVPKLARYLGAYVKEDFLVRVGQILHLGGPIPRDFFVTTGSRVLWDFLSGSASAVLTAPIHAVFEKMRGHKVTVESFLDGVATQLVTGGAFQVLMGGLANMIIRTPVGGYRPPAGESAQFRDLLSNAGVQTHEGSLRTQLDFYRSSPDTATLLKGVSDEQLMAVIGYTGADYEVINIALRMGDKQLISALRPYIELARRGLQAMPSHEGTVWRGVKHGSPQSMAKYQVGAIMTEDAFTSTSSTPDAAFSGKVQMEIVSMTGKEISKISFYQHQNEVLFPPGTQFRVLERTETPELTRLKMEEVRP